MYNVKDLSREVLNYDIILGRPGDHDLDAITVVEGVATPHLIQACEENGRRLDLIVVPPSLGPEDVVQGGDKSFQSIAEMLLANGSPVSVQGRSLTVRLRKEVSPSELARKYRKTAAELMFAVDNRKSWAARSTRRDIPQVKKAIPLYRVACDLLPRAFHMERVHGFPGGVSPEVLAGQAGLQVVYSVLFHFFEMQYASQKGLEWVAGEIEHMLEKTS